MPNPELAGKPYRPESVAEGRMFRIRKCYRCTQYARKHGCILLARVMNNADYPPEWTHDEQGRPTCTKFEEV